MAAADRLAVAERIAPSEQERLDRRDDRLVLRIQETNDDDATGELYSRYFPQLCAYAGVILDGGDVEDAAQEVFLKALKALPRYKVGDGAPFRGWLFKIAQNHCRDELRKSSQLEVSLTEDVQKLRDERLVFDGEDAPSSWPSDASAASLLTELPEARHRVLALDCLGFKTKEIASALDCTPGAVRILKCRGQRTLRERLEREAQAGPDTPDGVGDGDADRGVEG